MTKCLNKNALNKYLKMSGFIGLFMLIYFIAQMIAFVAAAIIFAVNSYANVLSLNTTRLETWINQNTCYLLLFSVLIAFPFYLLVSFCRKERFFEAAGFRKIGIRKIILSASLGIGINIVLTMVISLMPIERWFPGYIESMKYIDYNDILSIIPAVVIMGPIMEEIIFRGLILRELRKNLPITAAIIIQGVLFGIYHLNMLQSIYTAFIGIMLGFVFAWTGSIWASIIVHVFSNFTNIFLDKVLGGVITEHMLLVMVLSLIVSVFAARALKAEGKRNEDIQLCTLKE